MQSTAQETLARSNVVFLDDEHKKRSEKEGEVPARTSENTHIPRDSRRFPIMYTVDQRVRWLTRVPMMFGEATQVVR